MTIPLVVEVWTGDFEFAGTVGDPISVTIIQRALKRGISTATVAVTADHHRIPALQANGARLRILDENREEVFSGRISNERASGPFMSTIIEFDADSNTSVLRDVIGWPKPTAAITAQTDVSYLSEGTAEFVMKDIVKKNAVDRLGLPLTIATNLDRGPHKRVKMRYDVIYDKLVPTVDGAGFDTAGLEPVVIHDPAGGGLIFDVREVVTVPQELTEESGIVTGWNYNRSRSTATRVVVGGANEGTLRIMRTKADTARETAEKWKIERFRDARDVAEEDDPDELYDRADETLLDGAPKAGISLELSETANFRYGVMFLVGDIVTCRLGLATITDSLQEVTLSWTRDGGFTSRPRLGDKDSDPDRSLLKMIRDIARSIKARKTET